MTFTLLLVPRYKKAKEVWGTPQLEPMIKSLWARRSLT
jgi:hypothetical protein